MAQLKDFPDILVSKVTWEPGDCQSLCRSGCQVQLFLPLTSLPAAVRSAVEQKSPPDTRGCLPSPCRAWEAWLAHTALLQRFGGIARCSTPAFPRETHGR